MKTLFPSVKVSQMLFEGIRFCSDATKVAGIICSMIKQQNLQTVKVLADGSMKFSLLGHVSICYRAVTFCRIYWLYFSKEDSVAVDFCINDCYRWTFWNIPNFHWNWFFIFYFIGGIKKNDTHDGLHRMRTGVDNILGLGELMSWQQKTSIKVWMNSSEDDVSECNRISGTDGTIFPPNLRMDSVLQTFTTDLCRWDYWNFLHR